jgi:hypothetical protein
MEEAIAGRSKRSEFCQGKPGDRVLDSPDQIICYEDVSLRMALRATEKSRQVGVVETLIQIVSKARNGNANEIVDRASNPGISPSCR